MLNDIITLIKEDIEEANVDAQKVVSAKVLAEKKMQFDNYGANDWDQNPFPPIKESTIRRKQGNDKSLLRTGKLRDSLHMEDEGDFTSIASDEVENEAGESYNEYAKDFITDHGGEHYYDELSELEVDASIDLYISTFINRLENAS